MLEQDGPYSQESTNRDIFRDLEGALADPFVEKAYEDVRIYNSLFEDHTPTAQEVSDAISELDEKWGTALSSHLEISGELTMQGYKTVRADGLSAISMGFDVMNTPIVVGGEVIGNTARLYHLIQADAADLYDKGLITAGDLGIEGEISVQALAKVKINLVADIDKTHIAFSNISYERARAWLETSYPEFVEDVEVSLFTERQGYEDPLMGLVDFNISDYGIANDEITLKSLEVFLNNRVAFDISSPYDIRVDGYGVSMLEDDDDLYRFENMRRLSHLLAIIVEDGEDSVVSEAHSGGNGEGIRLSVYAVFLGEDSKSDPEHYGIPLEYVKSARAIRRIYYGD